MIIAIFFIIGMNAAFAQAINDAGVKIKWGYKGNIVPVRWAQLDPQFSLCATGKAQSPINITKKTTKATNKLSFHYTASPLHLVTDGKTDLTLGQNHVEILDGHSVQLNFPTQSAKNTVNFNDVAYRLLQLHFHTPSETEWNNQVFPLEIQFVHQGDNGKVLILAVLVKGGAENAGLKKIIEHLHSEKSKIDILPSSKINPMDLLPAKHNRYYSYAGSLTAPPCTEGVQWVVMADTITATPAQILILRAAMGGANARPVQPLHKRVILYTTESE